MAEFFRSYRKSTLYLKGFSQSEGPTKPNFFAVPSMFEKRKADAESFLRHIQKA